VCGWVCVLDISIANYTPGAIVSEVTIRLQS